MVDNEDENVFSCVACEWMIPHICKENFTEDNLDNKTVEYRTDRTREKINPGGVSESRNEERNENRIRQVMEIT